MRVLLVDDEEIALEVLERMLKKIGDIQILGKYTDPEKALARLKTEGADAVFLDLEMGGRHGLQFAQELLCMDSSPGVIFVTAYSQYAVDAFEVDAVDYLLKPVTMTRLERAVQKIEERQRLKRIQKVQSNGNKTNIWIHSLGAFQMFTEEEALVPMRWRTKKGKEMFCYLWLNKEKPVNKYRILEELWPEVALDKGTALLHTTVYQLRKVIKELQIEDGLQYINDQYVLNLPIKSDLDELKDLLEETNPAPEQMKRILELYEGDLFELDEYNWCIYERQSLKNTYLSCLQKYAEKNRKEFQNEIVEKCMQKMFKMDIYNERYVIMLINYYADTGNTKEMMEAYKYYCKVLWEDLGIVPSRKVIELYRKYIKKE
ncbi:response regulator [Anaerocolumna xylanovorans]|uniref:Stage 0 sporulation protein A homolog n=1 Tax=Anaerocolumna xylanovorans DSM 12503 TaxID=1121345 RepID=A0A1M7Y782_9FIRM|nr:response regulator [Anaerocolumna xylanovorans]SHO48493.1 Two-component response regulator, SAPR family, consists of REC, wHTH and BTAD domains [Anaerocolumna xylanovorans DSM 12503]